jgi:hypothetical protein
MNAQKNSGIVGKQFRLAMLLQGEFYSASNISVNNGKD